MEEMQEWPVSKLPFSSNLEHLVEAVGDNTKVAYRVRKQEGMAGRVGQAEGAALGAGHHLTAWDRHLMALMKGASTVIAGLEAPVLPGSDEVM